MLGQEILLKILNLRIANILKNSDKEKVCI